MKSEVDVPSSMSELSMPPSREDNENAFTMEFEEDPFFQEEIADNLPTRKLHLREDNVCKEMNKSNMDTKINIGNSDITAAIVEYIQENYTINQVMAESINRVNEGINNVLLSIESGFRIFAEEIKISTDRNVSEVKGYIKEMSEDVRNNISNIVDRIIENK
jgi:DNA-directed RNA polymerase subunit L